MTPSRILVAALLLAACGGKPIPPTADQVQEVAAIATLVKADPAKADKVLADHGLDRAAFEALLFDIAADPAKSQTYAAALK
jgi:hypothetical protein